jgi:hypothetical protein
MVTDSRRRPKPKRLDRKSELNAIPSPEKVRAMACDIRRTWSPRERRRRALLARYLILRQFIAG